MNSGDSGGGLVFRDALTRRFYVQGVASNVDSRPLTQLKYCQNYNTFTRVSSFVDWIQDELDEFFADDPAEYENIQVCDNATYRLNCQSDDDNVPLQVSHHTPSISTCHCNTTHIFCQ